VAENFVVEIFAFVSKRNQVVDEIRTLSRLLVAEDLHERTLTPFDSALPP
jgi:hypothetical protein